MLFGLDKLGGSYTLSVLCHGNRAQMNKIYGCGTYYCEVPRIVKSRVLTS